MIRIQTFSPQNSHTLEFNSDFENLNFMWSEVRFVYLCISVPLLFFVNLEFIFLKILRVKTLKRLTKCWDLSKNVLLLLLLFFFKKKERNQIWDFFFVVVVFKILRFKSCNKQHLVVLTWIQTEVYFCGSDINHWIQTSWLNKI